MRIGNFVNQKSITLQTCLRKMVTGKRQRQQYENQQQHHYYCFHATLIARQTLHICIRFASHTLIVA